ncbi:MAG TPA: alpha-L-fucosidase [Candidatus Merdivicinus excrementipullorum]|uniref:Alpha-L-fucosidase n=1 Tax=Candidatus Merdivicinus excrementipullorum TaxID=2840867 RepID=A0A9D1FPR3_9FIRM|nr:alpha-L-fucosidase [Candidatus Merdivicinus excrementipullorum]
MWYQNDYRRIFMDMHLNDSNSEEYLSKLDVDNFVARLKEADASSIVVKAKSHVGLHYWPSKYGRMHEGLKRRDLDYVGEMVKKCHENGINVIVYLSQIYDNYAYDNHPAWRMVNAKGETSREDGSRYGLVCPNNLEYRQYVREILQELNTLYQFEGMFLDMPFWPEICYCDSCRERFFRETGHDLPRKIDWDDPIWVEYAHRRQRWMEEFMMENTKAVKEIRSEVTIEHNFAAVGTSDWYGGDTEKGLAACDYAGGDYYGGYLQQSFMCKYYNSVTPNKPFCYITSRCDPSLFFHTVSRSRDDLLIHAIDALMHNGAFSICDAMNPDGTITDEMYEGDIKDVFAQMKPLEKYVSGNMLADAAVLYHTEQKSEKNYIQSPFNAADVLREYNILFNVIGCKNLKGLRTQVLSINDVPVLSDEEMDDIERYIRNGGNLLITGHLGHKRLEELLGIRITGKSEYSYSYLNPTKAGAKLFKTFTKASPYPIEHYAWMSEVTEDGAEMLATLSFPYTKPGSRDFAAIHSNPPGIHTEMPGAIRRKVGEGSILWVCAPLELTKATHCREALCALFRSLMKGTLLTSNAPEFVETLLWEKDGCRYLGVINQQAKTPVYPISGITVTFPEVIKNVTTLTTDGKTPELTIENGSTTLHLPTLDVFQMYCLDETH